MIRRLFLFAVFIACSFDVRAELNKSLLNELDRVYGKPTHELDREERLYRGKWNSNKSTFVIAENIQGVTLVYVFLIDPSGKVKSIKIWDIDANDMNSKLGRPLSYYDHYNITPNINDSSNNKSLSITITTQAWLESDRYTIHSKPVMVSPDGSLDWSHF